MCSFEDAVKKQLNIRKVASNWYLRFNKGLMCEEELKEFNKDLNKYNVDFESVNIIMKDYYIDYLEDIIDILKENKEVR
jgi:hypothetical protein